MAKETHRSRHRSFRLRHVTASPDEIRDEPLDYPFGAPELIVELAESSAEFDLHEKKNLYLRTGVGEYLVYETARQQIPWCSRQSDRWIALRPDSDRVWYSRLFGGLALDEAGLRTNSGKRILRTLRRRISPS